MATFLRTVLVQNRAEGADRSFQEDLPVNPLTAVLVTLRALTVAADVTSPIADLYAMMPELAVSFRGQDIVRGRLQDLAVLNAVMCGSPPWGLAFEDGANEGVSITVPIVFGRRPYMAAECFPAVRRGDLVLSATVDVAVGNFDTLELQIETVELLDETPERYLKYVTGGQTFSGTGEESVRLPIGNPLLAVLLWGTTVPAAGAWTATWERVRTKVDNVEALYARANWNSLHGEFGRRLKGPADFLQQHVHRYNGAAAAFANSLEPMRPAGILEQYGLLDFDPLEDGSYMLETAGRADVVIQRDAGTATLGRFMPVELVAVRGGA